METHVLADAQSISRKKRKLNPPATWSCLPHAGKGLRREKEELQGERAAVRRGGSGLCSRAVCPDLRNACCFTGWFLLTWGSSPSNWLLLSWLRFSPTPHPSSHLFPQALGSKPPWSPPWFSESSSNFIYCLIFLSWRSKRPSSSSFLRLFKFWQGVADGYLGSEVPAEPGGFPGSRNLWAQEGTCLFLSPFFGAPSSGSPVGSHPLDIMPPEDLSWVAWGTGPALEGHAVQGVKNAADGWGQPKKFLQGGSRSLSERRRAP